MKISTTSKVERETELELKIVFHADGLGAFRSPFYVI